jgi:hypothetical protein
MAKARVKSRFTIGTLDEKSFRYAYAQFREAPRSHSDCRQGQATVSQFQSATSSRAQLAEVFL